MESGSRSDDLCDTNGKVLGRGRSGVFAAGTCLFYSHTARSPLRRPESLSEGFYAQTNGRVAGREEVLSESL